MPILTTPELQLHYQTFGDASNPALVFSNSLGTNYGMWQQQFNAEVAQLALYLNIVIKFRIQRRQNNIDFFVPVNLGNALEQCTGPGLRERHKVTGAQEIGHKIARIEHAIGYADITRAKI